MHAHGLAGCLGCCQQSQRSQIADSRPPWLSSHSASHARGDHEEVSVRARMCWDEPVGAVTHVCLSQTREGLWCVVLRRVLHWLTVAFRHENQPLCACWSLRGSMFVCVDQRFSVCLLYIHQKWYGYWFQVCKSTLVCVYVCMHRACGLICVDHDLRGLGLK